MIDHLRRNAIAYVALFVALGGTSYAAVSLRRNSVGTAQLKNGAVTGPKVKLNSLTASDFEAGSLPIGPMGPKGDTGPGGPAGLSVSVVQDDLPAATAPGSLSSAIPIKQVTIDLPVAGKLVVIDPAVESLTFNNPTGSTVTYAGVSLYLDGNPVPNSGVPCTNCSIPPSTTSSAGPIQLPDLAIPGVSAGSHTLTLALIGNSTNYVTAASARLVLLATG
jgi:hypothetical protein